MAGFPFQKPSVMFKLSYFLLFAGLQKNKYISLMAFLVYIPLKMWQEIAKYGRKLVEHGLVESNFGNISIQDTSSLDIIASSEAVVHREIYRQTSALAIIHAHSAYSVVESLLAGPEGKITPVDSEGQYFLGEIPIVGGGIGSRELAGNLANALSRYRGAIVYSHGTFAIGRTLGDAYIITTQLEHSCKVKYLYDRAATGEKISKPNERSFDPRFYL